jgi:hypothetical protein
MKKTAYIGLVFLMACGDSFSSSEQGDSGDILDGSIDGPVTAIHDGTDASTKDASRDAENDGGSLDASLDSDSQDASRDSSIDVHEAGPPLCCIVDPGQFNNVNCFANSQVPCTNGNEYTCGGMKCGSMCNLNGSCLTAQSCTGTLQVCK